MARCSPPVSRPCPAPLRRGPDECRADAMAERARRRQNAGGTHDRRHGMGRIAGARAASNGWSRDCHGLSLRELERSGLLRARRAWGLRDAVGHDYREALPHGRGILAYPVLTAGIGRKRGQDFSWPRETLVRLYAAKLASALPTSPSRSRF